jgi:multicomponent Na+:H+ antiporter subunit A
MMLLLVLLGFGIAALAPWLYTVLKQRTGWVLAVYPLAVFVLLEVFSGRVADGNRVTEVHEYLPSMGISLSFALDGLSLLFGLLISGIGALVVIYAGGYLKGHPLLGRFFAYLMMFMSAMLGVVLADDLIALFVFWELTSISSYLLIGFNHEEEKSRESALQALLVTGGGGLALLAGLLMLGTVAGTFEISAIREQGEFIRSHALYVPIFALVALGAFTKSAQFPFHFWLPNAMAAPTPVSAYLHSATMVKAGVYLLARFDVVLGDTPLWTWTVGLTGLATMTLGAIRALRETDLKRILAYSTVTALGTLTLLIGLSFKDALKAAVVFLVVHSLYKGALFMVAGNVDHETGTRDVTRLGGLRSKLPFTSKAALVAAFSMAGFPPLFGFIGKELAYKAKLGLDVSAAWWVPALGVLANALTVTAALVVALRPFWGELRHLPDKEPHEAPRSMLLGPVVLAGYCLFLGLYPGHIEQRVIAPAVQAVLGKPMEIHLALWYGVNLALLLSVITVALGVACYVFWDPLRRVISWADPLWNHGAEAGYRLALRGLISAAGAQTRLIMAGGLRRYLLWIFVVVAAAPVGALLIRGGATFPTGPPSVYFTEWVLATVIASAAIAAAVAPGRLTAIASIGVVGFTIALLFQILSAPDLAITQLMVETLFVVIVVLVVHHLPKLAVTRPLTSAQTARNLAVAGIVGTTVTSLIWSVTALPFSPHVSEYFAAESVPKAHGQNVVNVVLVDFRATDTLGEIAVLAVAALSVYTLLKLRMSRTETDDVLEEGAP